jgi:hypothetical protein
MESLGGGGRGVGDSLEESDVLLSGLQKVDTKLDFGKPRGVIPLVFRIRMKKIMTPH